MEKIDEVNQKQRGVFFLINDRKIDGLRQYFLTYPTDVDYITIHGEYFFQSLVKTGFFKDLNDRCHTAIDEPDIDFIPPQHLKEALIVISKYRKTIKNVSIKNFLESLESMICRAICLKAGVYFLF